MELDEQVNDPVEIASNFRLSGKIRNVFPYGSGHINDTFKVLTGEKNYLLQRVNQQVFMDVRGLTSNLIRITRYLTELTDENQGQMQVLQTITTINGTYFFIDDDANFWRMFDFIEGGKSYDKPGNADLAREGGKAFGWFIKSLNKFPIGTLVETIPDFHNAESRLSDFRKAVEKDRAGCVEGVKDLIGFVEQRAESMMIIHRLGQEGKIPLRVTHNDTKINNVLFDENNRAIAVIDLDTVMPGYVHYDFGDAIRTFASPAEEDEKDLDKIHLNLDFFSAFAKGFLSETKSVLTREEITHMVFAPQYITWEQTVRFLADYLKGDHYYKIQYPEHNLVRARAQAKLLQSMEEQVAEMERLILQVIEVTD